MASRESQGLQVALILFVMITIALAVTTYVFYRKAEEQTLAQIAATEEKNRMDEALRKIGFQNQLLMHMCGFQTLTDNDLPTVLAQVDDAHRGYHDKFLADMAKLPESAPMRNYSALAPELIGAIRDRNTINAQKDSDYKGLESQFTAFQTQEENKTTQALAAKKAAEDDRDTVRAGFEAERGQFAAKTAAMQSGVDAQLATMRKHVSDATTETTSLKKEIEGFEKTIEGQQTQIAELRGDQTFQTPDGYIIRLLPDGTCWISLGLADGLRRQVTFSIYDRDVTEVTKQAEVDETTFLTDRKDKGKLEVLDVLDQHLALCKITEQSSREPILPGDTIFSTTWKAGRQIHVALAGFMDIDEDGRSDRSLVRNAITLSGGVIDAEAHDDGALTGAITQQTRYLVRGLAPPGQPDDAQVKSFYDLTGDAGRKGVQVVNVAEFLDRMGWKGMIRTVTLGEGANPEDFIEERPGNTGFRSRTPNN